MNELSFLLEILLNHKLGKVTKDAIKARIDEISKGPNSLFMPAPISGQQIQTMIQDDSVVRAQIAAQTFRIKPIEAPPVPPAQIGQTPAAQAALQARAEMIRQAQTGKPAKGFDTPPKAHGHL